jgi:hypothetical protein
MHVPSGPGRQSLGFGQCMPMPLCQPATVMRVLHQTGALRRSTLPVAGKASTPAGSNRRDEPIGGTAVRGDARTRWRKDWSLRSVGPSASRRTRSFGPRPAGWPGGLVLGAGWRARLVSTFGPTPVSQHATRGPIRDAGAPCLNACWLASACPPQSIPYHLRVRRRP